MSSPGSSRRDRRSERRRRTLWIAGGVVLALVVAVVAVVLVSGGSDSKDSASTASTATTGSPGATVTTRAGETTPTTKGNDAPTTTAGRPGGPCKAADVDMGLSGATIRDVNAVTVVSVTNTGGRSCTINGFPGVQLLGPDDAKVQTTRDPGWRWRARRADCGRRSRSTTAPRHRS